MSEEKTEKREVDRGRINLSQGDEVRYWSETLGASELEIQAAVEKVGPVADDVRAFLKKS